MIPSIIHLRPSEENCVAVQPELSGLKGSETQEEKQAVYGGGRNWLLKCSNNSFLKYIVLAHQKPLLIDFFVFRYSIVVWFNEYGKGIEVPFNCLLGYELIKNEWNELELQLTIDNKGVFESVSSECTQLRFKPLQHNFCNDEKLFIKEFGVFNNEIIERTFHSLNLNSVNNSIPSSDDSLAGSVNLMSTPSNKVIRKFEISPNDHYNKRYGSPTKKHRS